VMAGLASNFDFGDYMIGEDSEFAAVFEAGTAALYTFSIRQPVSIEKRSSALLPLYDLQLKSSEACVLFGGKGDCKAAVVIQNTSRHAFDMGSVSVRLDGSFVGEGVLAPLKPSEFACLTYAKEPRVQVSMEDVDVVNLPAHRWFFKDDDGKETTDPQRAKGRFKEHWREVETTYKTVNLSADRPVPLLLIEHRRLSKDSEVIQGKEHIDKRFKAPMCIRFRLSLAPKEERLFKVKERKLIESSDDRRPSCFCCCTRRRR